MLEEATKYETLAETTSSETNLIPSTTAEDLPIILNEEAQALITQIITETDEEKAKDLTYLFNLNQNKKTMVRVNKLSDLLDVITEQALARFTARPDQISNKELFDGLKVVQDLIERGQKQVTGTKETPLIQVNQQTNEVNIGNNSSKLSRDSREKVKNVVLDLLNNLTAAQPIQTDFVECSEEGSTLDVQTIPEGEVADGE